MNAPSGTPALVDLVVDAQGALHLTQLDLAKVTGASVRTIQRWMQGSSQPSSAQLERLVAALKPVDVALARRLAEVAGLSTASLGLEAPATSHALEPAAAPTSSSAEPTKVGPTPVKPEDTSLVPVLVEAVVAAAAEALQLPPQRARPAVLAAMERAERAGLSVGQLLRALRSAADGARPGAE